jgi:hypothetical protein
MTRTLDDVADVYIPWPKRPKFVRCLNRASWKLVCDLIQLLLPLPAARNGRYLDDVA